MTPSDSPEPAVLDDEVSNEPITLESDLIYKLEDRPPLIETLFVALQHVLAVFVGIVTPPFIICNTLELEGPDTTFIISMSLMISGIATFIQTKRIGPVGSGLLSIQGTSFAFLGPILAAGFAAINSGQTKEQALGIIFGLCFFGAFVEIFFSQFLHLARKFITPLVTGVVVTLIGLTLIKVGIVSVGGGARLVGTEDFGNAQNLGLAALVLIVILVLNSFNSPYLRMSAIVAGLAVGYIAAIPMGLVNFSNLSNLAIFTVPIPFRYGMGFSWSAFIPFIFLYLITTIESIGDLTATSAISGEPIQGSLYMRRIKGGVLGDGINSLIAACFSTFPNTTFSQNNGVIQLTGVGSRYVGYFIAGFLVLLGLFPIVSGVVQAMPQPVLGGATILMFATVAVAGVKILSCVNLTKRNSMILAVSLGLGLGVTFMPEILDNTSTLVKSIFSSGIATGGLSALILNLIIPGPRE
ncbi:MAG: purine permease [Spirulina sp. DLM2.Bin59]|nr:MAG: purine permease [Spirulina sp. DLM2.Bin59]